MCVVSKSREERAAEKLANAIEKLKGGGRAEAWACREFLGLVNPVNAGNIVKAVHDKLDALQEQADVDTSGPVGVAAIMAGAVLIERIMK